MKELYEKHKLFFLILSVLATGFLVWYFSHIVILIVVAVVVSIIGIPLVELLDRIRIRRFKMPHGLSAGITLLIIVVLFFGMFSFIIPLILKEANMISSIDSKGLAEYYKNEIAWLHSTLVRYGIMPREASIEGSVKEMVLKLIDFGMFSNILSSVISFTGNFFFNVFTIIFLTFFFLFDVKMMPRLFLLLIPRKYEEQTKSVMVKSKQLLSRYFIGLIIEVLLNMILYSVALLIIGVKGAIVIGFFAGVLIVIPYIGGIIGLITGVLLGVTGVISQGEYAAILPMTIKIMVAMLIVQAIDNNLLQPYIQGKVVRGHPVEIFILVIAAASIGGIPAMIVAVPAYGFLKIVAVEFLSQFRLVQKMKEKQ